MLFAVAKGEQRATITACSAPLGFSFGSSLQAPKVMSRMVGLRPFRRHGFRIGLERHGGKTIVHHYGHGGSGVTLSWGTSAEVISILKANGLAKGLRVAVLGCGAVGLATAYRLMEAGYLATIYSKDAVLRTTSAVAGARIYPSLLIDSDKLTEEFEILCRKALSSSVHMFTSLVGERYGVRWHPVFYRFDQRPTLAWEDVLAAKFFPEPRPTGSRSQLFKSSMAGCDHGLFVDMPVYLNAILNDLCANGIKVVRREVSSVDDLQLFEEDCVINCMGLGASSLGKLDMIPIRGQAVILEAADIHPKLAIEDGGFYLYPRGRKILIGGGADVGSSSTTYDIIQERKILNRLQAIIAS